MFGKPKRRGRLSRIIIKIKNRKMGIIPQFSPSNKLDRYPQCTPEFTRRKLAEIEEATKMAAYEMRRGNDTPSRSRYEANRERALNALRDLKQTCGNIAIPSLGKTYRREQESFDALYTKYKNGFNTEISSPDSVDEGSSEEY